MEALVLPPVCQSTQEPSLLPGGGGGGRAKKAKQAYALVLSFEETGGIFCPKPPRNDIFTR